jgi:DUF3099 family protein
VACCATYTTPPHRVRARRPDYHREVSSNRRHQEPEPGDVVKITSAPEPLTSDMSRRQSRYLIQMVIRVVCFLAAVLTWGKIPMAVSIVLLVATVVLPYSAVLFANAGRERDGGDASFLSQREIGGGPGDLGGLGPTPPPGPRPGPGPDGTGSPA